MKKPVRNVLFFSLLFCLWFLTASFLQANPFVIDVPSKEILSSEEYLSAQTQLREIDIAPLLKEIQPSDPAFATFEEFYWRCTRGLKQTLINPEKGLFPRKYLEQIGSRKDMCIVTHVSYDKDYPSLVKKIPEALRKVGFSGFVLYSTGGFPNPTGTEIQYAGVPYCFKVFMMLEAHKLGFNKVFWVDSSILPLRDPTPLFDWLDKHDAFLLGFAKNIGAPRHITPPIRQLLMDLTGTDVLEARFVSTIVFGLKMNAPKVTKLIEDYYEFVKLGTPFLSYFPEEFVLTAIMGQDDFKHWVKQPYKLIKHTDGDDTEAKIKKAKKDRYYFYHLKH